jgi:translation initiation factor IF-2
MNKQDQVTSSAARPPIVTIMGHVDHGKTSLLDAIRQTNVTAGESGGITQHIGAYQVEHNGQKITFIDTPGHAAFSQMRARGANVTDIVILVVAANDGVMPQTKEAIAHAKAANVPIIVAMNKIDVDGANPQKVKDQLAKEGILVEGYGGDIPVIETSATQKIGINELLEMIQLVAEMQELPNQPDASTEAVVIESHQDTKRGPLATVLVKQGTLKIGDALQIGATYGKVRSLIDDQGQTIKTAGPSTPVEILGLKTVPTVGTVVLAMDNERQAEAAAAQSVVDNRKAPEVITDISQLFGPADANKELKLVLKADAQGSMEAIIQSINELEMPEGTSYKLLLAGTGNVSESDALLAAAANALILAFRVKVDSAAQRVIQQDGILVQSYDIIYKLLDDIGDVLAGGIPEKEVPVKGRAEVLQVFELKSGDMIAGCKIIDGMIRKNWKVQVWRKTENEEGEEQDEMVVEQAVIHEIRHGADKVNESKKNSECGVMIRPNFEFKLGDRIEAI